MEHGGRGMPVVCSCRTLHSGIPTHKSQHPQNIMELQSRNDMLARENLELKQQLLTYQDRCHRVSMQHQQTWCQLQKLTRMMETYLQENRPLDMENIGSQTAASLLQGLPGFQLASLSSLGTYTTGVGDTLRGGVDPAQMPSGLGPYSDLAETSQRAAFVHGPRDGYPMAERKMSYDPEAAMYSRFEDGGEPAMKRARASIAAKLGFDIHQESTRSLLASQMARMGVPSNGDEMMGQAPPDAFATEATHARHSTPRMRSMYTSPEMPGRHHSSGGNSNPSVHHHHHATQPSPQVDDGDKYFLAAKVNNIFEIWQEFFHQGPDGKPPVIQLMAKYGVEKWFYRSTTPEGLNNRKNIWNRRNKAVVFELLYLIYHEGKTEEEALASLDAQLVNGSLKTPTVAGLAYHLREKGVVSMAERKSTVDHILLSLISKLNPEPLVNKRGTSEDPYVPVAAEEDTGEVQDEGPAAIPSPLLPQAVPSTCTDTPHVAMVAPEVVQTG